MLSPGAPVERKKRCYCGLSWIIVVRTMLAVLVFGACLLLVILRCRIGIWAKREALPADVVQAHVPGLGSLHGRAGVGNVSDIAQFLRVPYAMPPIDDLRWRGPKPYGPWESPRDAAHFGAMCPGALPEDGPNGAFWPGPGDLMDAGEDRPEVSENCLFLNIFTPLCALPSSSDTKVRAALPVMVWIHGGGYSKGTPNFFPAANLVASSNGSVVVVTVAFRLGALGFLGGPALKGRGHDGTDGGHFGIADQGLALEWVRDNIAAFGGDPARVTLFGESAGGNAVLHHLVRPASRDLFARAIVQSGAYDASVVRVKAEENYAALLNLTGCGGGGLRGSGLQCLLALPASELMLPGRAKQMPAPWGPVVDGVSLSAPPNELIAAGKYSNTVPVLMGSDRDEFSYFLLRQPPRLICPPSLPDAYLDVYLDGLLQQMPAASNSSLAANQTARALGIARIREAYAPTVYPYPTDLGNYSQAWWTVMRVFTDAFYPGACQHRRVIRQLVQGGTPAAYYYLFAHPGQAKMGLPGTGPGSVTVPHGVEIPFVFQSSILDESSNERDLAQQLAAYWLHFAAAGDPNHPGAPKWPAYTLEDDISLRFNVPPAGTRTQQHLRRQACDLWDELLKEGR
mmetsp:Transcript_54377/g.116886  ORF Transcript_54377/g.116886 Transcript_54377/m.116886 type:complete len:626 (-) Transcript_54377:106-1983(-)